MPASDIGAERWPPCGVRQACTLSALELTSVMERLRAVFYGRLVGFTRFPPLVHAFPATMSYPVAIPAALILTRCLVLHRCHAGSLIHPAAVLAA